MSTATLTITSKGQVTLKQRVLEHLGVRPGDRVEVVLTPGGKVELSPVTQGHDISAVFGLLHRPGQPVVTVEQMDEAIAAAVVEDVVSGRRL